MAFRAAARGGQGQSVQANNVVVTIPATAVAGDVALVFIATSSNPTMASPPTGWTIESGPDGDASNTFRGFLLSADIAASGTNSPGSNVTFQISFAARIVATMLVFSGRTRTGMQVATPIVQGTVTSAHTLPTLTGVPAGADLVGGVTRRRADVAGTITATGYTKPTNGDVSTTYGAAQVNTWAQGAYILASAGGSVGGNAWTGSVTSVGVIYLVSLPLNAVSADFSGSGTLSTAQTPAVPLPAALSGSGTLSTTQAPAVARAASLSGSGTLTTTQLAAVSRAAAFSGDGTLSVTRTPGWSRAAAFSGSGTLVAIPFGYVQPTFSGSGTLTATASPGYIRAAVFSGDGTLTTSQLIGVIRAAGFSGSGTLVTATAPGFVKAAVFSGSGTLLAVATARYRFAIWTGTVYRPITPRVRAPGGVWRTDIPVEIVPATA